MKRLIETFRPKNLAERIIFGVLGLLFFGIAVSGMIGFAKWIADVDAQDLTRYANEGDVKELIEFVSNSLTDDKKQDLVLLSIEEMCNHSSEESIVYLTDLYFETTDGPIKTVILQSFDKNNLKFADINLFWNEYSREGYPSDNRLARMGKRYNRKQVFNLVSMDIIDWKSTSLIPLRNLSIVALETIPANEETKDLSLLLNRFIQESTKLLSMDSIYQAKERLISRFENSGSKALNYNIVKPLDIYEFVAASSYEHDAYDRTKKLFWIRGRYTPIGGYDAVLIAHERELNSLQEGARGTVIVKRGVIFGRLWASDPANERYLQRLKEPTLYEIQQWSRKIEKGIVAYETDSEFPHTEISAAIKEFSRIKIVHKQQRPKLEAKCIQLLEQLQSELKAITNSSLYEP